MSASFLRRSGWVAAGVVVVAAGILSIRTALNSKAVLPISAAMIAAPVGDLPILPDKPQPTSFTLDGCPPEGNGGDPELNFLKNRADRGTYMDVSFDSLTTLTWPKNVERVPMAQWPESSRSFIEQYEGTPITVIGYIVGLREAMPDPAVCNWSGSSYLDWHMSFTQNARDDRSTSILAEVTPRIRMIHRWTMDSLHAFIMDNHVAVRLSGWLYFDPDHPGDVGVTRATLWEINPVMLIEVQDKNRWVPLDTLVH